MSVSLIAMAAVAASLLVARQRQPVAAADIGVESADERPAVSLDELRRAGI